MTRPNELRNVYKAKFNTINERPVDDISLELFYKPHTITLLAVSIAAVVYFSFIRDEHNLDDNIRAGVFCVVFFFLIISVLAFPNGPFTRPHPAVWRIVFGVSVLYLMTLVFLLFQNYKTVMSILYWIDPALENFHIDMDKGYSDMWIHHFFPPSTALIKIVDPLAFFISFLQAIPKEYGVNCSVITIEKIWDHLDVFALGHFVGWFVKAFLIRHLGLLWVISIMWEFTEIAFAHLLPNFVECWWDALILDVLICNGLGIWLGLKVCKFLEMREYKWVSIRDIHSTTGKLKRAMLQFTPGSWSHVRWLDPTCTYMRFFAICQLVISWQICELNTFFLKHIFEMPPSHPLVIWRIVLVCIVVAPSVRQYYIYATDPQCKRIGTQCWVYGAILATEALLCIKNGKELFSHTQAINIILWLLIISLLSILCVYGFVLWHKYFQNGDLEFSRDTSPCKSPSLSFSESESKSEMEGNLLEDSEPSTLIKRRQTRNGLSDHES